MNNTGMPTQEMLAPSAVMANHSGALPKTTILGYPVHRVTCRQAIEATLLWLQSASSSASSSAAPSKQPSANFHVITLNPEIIMAAEQQPALASVVRQAALSLPDGAGVVWAIRRQGYTDQIRVPGIEYSAGMLAQCAQQGLPVALIGASPAVMEKLPEALSKQYPGLNIVFYHHGYFETPEQRHHIAKLCADTAPAIVLVALGFPAQDQWIVDYDSQFNHAVLVGVGGSFDVWTGTVERAPAFMRQLNLEWCYRFVKQPWRIRRAGKQLALFVIKVLSAPNRAA